MITAVKYFGNWKERKRERDREIVLMLKARSSIRFSLASGLTRLCNELLSASSYLSWGWCVVENCVTPPDFNYRPDPRVLFVTAPSYFCIIPNVFRITSSYSIPVTFY